MRAPSMHVRGSSGVRPAAPPGEGTLLAPSRVSGADLKRKRIRENGKGLEDGAGVRVEGSRRSGVTVASEVLTSPGEPLSSEQRALSSGFGYDFSRVRLHTDSSAARLPERMDARAFTVGQHVVFGRGGVGDTALLRHELTHVVQQTAPKEGGDSSYAGAEMEAHRMSQSSRGGAVVGRRPIGVACAPNPSSRGNGGAGGKPDMAAQHRYTEGVDQTRNMTYKTAEGELGVPDEVVVHRNPYQQSKVSAGTGDDAGHLIADLFGGAGGRENLSLQNWKANEFGTFKKLENSFAKKLKSGVTIRVKVTDNTRIGEDRPFYRHVEWTETAQDGVVSEHVLDFANMHTPESRVAQKIRPTTGGSADNDVIHVNFKTKQRATTAAEIDAKDRSLDATRRRPTRIARGRQTGGRGAAVTPEKLPTTAPAHGAAGSERAVSPGVVRAPVTPAGPGAIDAPAVTADAVSHVTIPEGDVPTVVPEPEVSGRGIGAVAHGVSILMMLGSLLPDYALEESTAKKFQEALEDPRWQARLQELQPEIDSALGDRFYSIRYRILYFEETSPKPIAFPPSRSVKSLEVLDLYVSRSDETVTSHLHPEAKPDNAKLKQGGGYFWQSSIEGVVSQPVESGGQARARRVIEKKVWEMIGPRLPGGPQ